MFVRENMFVATNTPTFVVTNTCLSRQKLYLGQILPMISNSFRVPSQRTAITGKMHVSESIVHDDFRSKEFYSEYLCTTEEKRNTAR